MRERPMPPPERIATAAGERGWCRRSPRRRSGVSGGGAVREGAQCVRVGVHRAVVGQDVSSPGGGQRVPDSPQGSRCRWRPGPAGAGSRPLAGVGASRRRAMGARLAGVLAAGRERGQHEVLTAWWEPRGCKGLGSTSGGGGAGREVFAKAWRRAIGRIRASVVVSAGRRSGARSRARRLAADSHWVGVITEALPLPR